MLSKRKKLFLFILIAYVFSVLCRFYWVYWASSFEEFFFNDELMIISNDGYAFAEGARDMIAGFHQENDLSYYGSSLSTLTYLLYKILPFSFESIILYMSVFLSSLLVVPIILIAREYELGFGGLVAALLASVANSYYNRTMAGYYDTDMLAIVLPCFVIYFMIRIIKKQDLLALILLPVFIIFYLWYYASAYTLVVALIGLFFIYNLIYHRKDKIVYMASIFMLIAISSLAWYYLLCVIAILFALFVLKNEYFKPKFIAFLGILVIIFLLLSGGLDPILYQLEFYIFKSDMSSVAGSSLQSFTYFNVNQTIQEVGDIDISVFMQRISASELVFILSLFGLVLLLKEHKSFVLALPMLFLGFLALRSGLRFTIYAVPVMALAFGYFYLYACSFLKNFKYNNQDAKLYKILSFIAIFACFILAFIFENTFIFELGTLFVFILLILYFLNDKDKLKIILNASFLFISLFFALKHIYEYKAPTVFAKNEVEILNSLKEMAQREDYVIAWWDYGYPIRYYSDVKTLADGGKHLGKDNFFPSFVLSKDQISAANMARLSVEYTEQNFKTPFSDILAAMMSDYGENNELLFFNQLSKKSFPMKTAKSRDVYIYMPNRMAQIFSTVASFSNIDLKNGEINSPFFFSSAYAISTNNSHIMLSNGILISSDFTRVIIGNEEGFINSFIELTDIQNARYNIREIDKSSNLYMFFIQPSQFIIMDKSMYESAFVQMFFLNNYDKELYELVINSPYAKVFKLKR